MAYNRNITAEDKVFFDTDFILRFAIYSGDPTAAEIAAGTAIPEDVAGWDMEWMLRLKANTPDPPLIVKTTGSPAGIVVTGVFNASAAMNTQRVEVTIEDEDTYGPEGDPVVIVKEGDYAHSLKRIDPGAETILTWGSFKLLRAAAWE